MSERILRALMQLFAIVAKVDEVSHKDKGATVLQSTAGKKVIESFLKSELSSSDVEKYLNIFEDFLNSTRGKIYNKSGDKKRTSLHSVKVLRICEQINKELTQRQKFIVLVRIFEFIHSDEALTEKEMDFIQTVADSFNISGDEFQQIHDFIQATEDDIVDEKNHVYYCAKNTQEFEIAKFAEIEGLEGFIHAIYIQSVKTIFFRYFGKHELFINGQISDSDKTHVFNIGSTIRTTKSQQIFYSDLISRVLDRENRETINFEVDKISHSFKAGNLALKELSLTTSSGNLVGIMGGSGTGKTTLMNIMNGKIKPTSGSLRVNGLDLHANPKALEGVIGHVSQNDLLIEELSVFENLYFSARLCMKGYSDKDLTKKVAETLKMLGLYEIRYLKVGSKLDKVISGGQRKRLNIALELIREPSILFVDEPTSGLSSRDSENIMDLLKELSLNGKLVFVVIHQPSSNIFKLFDRLLIMDKGGYPIYDGNPLNAIVHFKTYSFRGNAHERECSLCGNVNPEQIFDLIDARIVDEFGNETQSRKRTAKYWHKLYLENREKHEKIDLAENAVSITRLPSKWRQFTTYVRRDVLSKASNLQYILVNSLVAPILALVLSFFIKYFDSGEAGGYSFYGNENIPQYIFIAVIVSIFLGLTVAAEEINKDKEILSRESYLHISRSSYLYSKVLIMFTISAIQTGLFLLIGNLILGISENWLEYWLVLFSTACASNLLGLNISSAFNSAKVIYIIVPLLIIPQLLFSGVIVKFDKLHPSLSDANKVPWVGNMMISRWAYEGLAVEQSIDNSLMKKTFEFELEKSESKWKKDYWLPEIQSRIVTLQTPEEHTEKELEEARTILINEIEREDAFWSNLTCESCISDLKSKDMTSESDFKNINKFLDYLKTNWNEKVNKNTRKINDYIHRIGESKYIELKKKYTNEALNDLVTNRFESEKIIVHEGRLYQNDDPVFNDPVGVRFFDTHFYAPHKYLFGRKYSTFNINLVLIWVISILTYIALYFDIIRHVLVASVRLLKRISGNRVGTAR
ncbi:MAG: ATP-binding cassette domain-containing protein [bacterium]|nr:ATP-binding cassette domain-containing protein [bacterium]